MDDQQIKQNMALNLFSNCDFRRMAILTTRGDYLEEFTEDFETLMYYTAPRDGEVSRIALEILSDVINIALMERMSSEDLIKLYGEEAGKSISDYMSLTKTLIDDLLAQPKEYKNVPKASYN